MSRIFVCIPSYRDPECYWTVKDLFEKAKYPQLISVGLCIQSKRNDNYKTFNPPDGYHGQIRSLKYNISESKGVCWARQKAQTLWKNEEYYLQIDAHMRFEQDWDEKLHIMYKKCDSKKPILSSLLPTYYSSGKMDKEYYLTAYYSYFNDDNMPTPNFRSHLISEAPEKPILSYICIGHFIFAKSSLIHEVPYDPHIYFYGEEVSFSVRAWTHGWDIFAPNGLILYHRWGERPRHWIDHHFSLDDKISYSRVKYLLGIENDNNETFVDLKKYNLGNCRTIEEYQKLASINFSEKIITS